jgi:hypothetical protein
MQPAQVDPGNRTVLRFGLRVLAPGRYAVRRRVLPVDSHTTEGVVPGVARRSPPPTGFTFIEAIHRM